VIEGRVQPRPAEAVLAEAVPAAAMPGDAAVLRALPLPPAVAAQPRPADDRFQPTQAILVGLRESRAMASLAADLVDRLSETAGADADTLRTRLREVVEIGSARDTAGPLAGLYAAARRDAASPLARVLAADGAEPGFRAALAAAGQELRALDERFAAREFTLAGLPPLQAAPPAPARPAALDLLA
jgi:hypothetical protein